jgi:hypothetical protein
MGFVGPHVQARLGLRSSRTVAKRLPGGVGRENGKSAFVADDGLAVDQARAHRQHGQGGDDLREAVREVIAIPGEQLHAASARRAMMRKPSCLI